MRRINNVSAKRVDSQTIHKYFNQMADAITAGCQKVWINTNPNTGEISFFIGKKEVRIKNQDLVKEGGLI